MNVHFFHQRGSISGNSSAQRCALVSESLQHMQVFESGARELGVGLSQWMGESIMLCTVPVVVMIEPAHGISWKCKEPRNNSPETIRKIGDKLMCYPILNIDRVPLGMYRCL